MTGAKSFNKSGFSLIEVLVSTALFVVIITGAMNIFKMVIESQRVAINTQNVEESLKYFLEVTSKEVRMAKRNNTWCSHLGLGPNDIYKVTTNSFGDVLNFKNYNDDCVTYHLVQDSEGTVRFSIARNGLYGFFITPSKINIDELKFVISTSTQPALTLELAAHSLGKNVSDSSMRIQTTLSSRYYKKD